MLFKQFDWLFMQPRISLHYSPPDKNRGGGQNSWDTGTDKHIFVLNEAAVLPNTKKATKFRLAVLN